MIFYLDISKCEIYSSVDSLENSLTCPRCGKTGPNHDTTMFHRWTRFLCWNLPFFNLNILFLSHPPQNIFQQPFGLLHDVEQTATGFLLEEQCLSACSHCCSMFSCFWILTFIRKTFRWFQVPLGSSVTSSTVSHLWWSLLVNH